MKNASKAMTLQQFKIRNMLSFRVTKYNPIYRDPITRAYSKDEWTSFSDIGQTFEGKRLIFAEYEREENSYIQSILLFMECRDIDILKIINLEKHRSRLKSIDKHDINTFNLIKNNKIISKEIIPSLVRLILREKLWCKLEANDMFVHFGWDYYMYIGSSKPCKSAITKIEKLGLFVEPFESPYLDDEEDE